MTRRKNSTGVLSEAQLSDFLAQRRRVLRRRSRLVKLTLATAVVLMVGAGGVFAWFSSRGTGTATASVGSIDAPTNVTAAAAASTDGGAHGTTPVTISWAAPSGGTVAPTGYYVTRFDEGNSDAPAAACGTSAASPTPLLTCPDTVSGGTYHYKVTGVYSSWTATSASSNSVTIVNDSTRPTSTITFPANNGSYNLGGWNGGCPTVGVCGTANDPGAGASGVAGVDVSAQRSSDNKYWDAGNSTWVVAQTFDAASTSDSWAHWSLPLAASNLTDGVSYTVTSRATDNAANVQSPLTTAVFIYDTTLPSISVTHTADGLNGWNTLSPVTVSMAVSDAGSGIAAKPTCTVDGSAATVSGTSSPYSVSVSGNGTHPVSCSVSDNVGNSNTGTELVKIDTVAPTGTTLTTTPAANGNGWINSTPVTITLSGTTDTLGSGVALVKYTTDGSDPTASATAQTYNSGSKPQVSATATFKYAGQDNAGNWETLHTMTVQIDTTPPAITVSHTADGSNGWNKTSPASDSVAVSDAGSGIAAKPTCTVDGSAATVSGTSSPYSVSVSGNGTHPVSCSVSDNAGNSNTGTDSVKIDTIAPSISVSHSADGLDGWNNTSPVSVSMAVSDAGSGIAANPTCTVDGSAATVSGTSSPYSVSVAGSGTHPVSCAVSDNAGNSNSGNDSVKIDTVAPTGTALTTSPVANGNGWINSTPVTITLSGASDSGGSGVALVRYTTDGTDPTTSATAQTYNSGGKPQVSATTTFKYAAQDTAGNWENVHATTVQIDTVAPSQTLSFASGATGGESITGSGDSWTIYYSGNAGGSFKLSDAVTEAGSGIGTNGVTYPTMAATAGWTPPTGLSCSSSSCVSNTYTWSAGPSGNPSDESITATDLAGNTDTVTLHFVKDSTLPSIAMSFPVNGGTYKIGNNGTGSWNKASQSACGTADEMCGTASDATGSGIQKVEVSVFSTAAGKYWDGTFTSGDANFTATSQTWVTVSGTTTWSQAWSSAAFNGVHNSFTVTARATDGVGNVKPTSNATFTTS